MSVRVRFAPSPTGQLHVGGLRTALYNYLFARKHGGSFILRIEDTDRKRFVENATESLIESLRWAGLDYDEGPFKGGEFGPYIQSERLDLYRRYAKQLVEQGAAYYAFDTPEELTAMREALKAEKKNFRYLRSEMKNSLTLSKEEVEQWLAEGKPYVIRLKVPEDREEYVVEDLVRGKIVFGKDAMDDQILLKADGFPTYHLACVVDDHAMGITHVIRGEEWLPSTPKHILLYELFGWEAPKMAHLPLLFNTDKTKMSKRKKVKGEQVEVNVEAYREQGYLPEALINFIALLGWSTGDDREIFSLEELIEEFSLEQVSRSGAVFDLEKLRWLNKQYLRELPAARIAEKAAPILEEAGLPVPSQEYLERVIELLRDRLNFEREIVDYPYFFQAPTEYEAKAKKKRWKAKSPLLLKEFKEELEGLENFSVEEIEKSLKGIAEKHEVGLGQLIHPTRLAISGRGSGPSLFDMMEILGKEESLKRLQAAIDNLS